MIDSHVHVFPDLLQKVTHSIPVTLAPDLTPVQRVRGFTRTLLRPLQSRLHAGQTLIRHLPAFTQSTLDRLGGLISAPFLLFESTPHDLLTEMDQAGLTHALVIASPPLASNEWVLQLCQSSDRLLPCVYAPETPEQLKEFVASGAKALKLHPAMDGKSADDPHYLALLEAAQELSLPVVLHTGCIHLNGLYRNPSFGNVILFRSWFERFPQITFILAHMNFHSPAVALDLCEEFPKLVVDTSWQPTEMIVEAIRRIGSERILLGSDWPLLGGNIPTAIERVKEVAPFGVAGPQEIDNILKENARRLFLSPATQPATEVR